MLSLAWLFESVWGRRILAFSGVVLLLLGVRAYFIHEGKLKEIAANQQQELKQSADQGAAERADLVKSLQQNASAMAAAAAQIQASQQQQRIFLAQLQQLQQQKQTADAALQKVPDSGLHGYITSKLELRSAADNSPGYLPAEERAIASCLTDAPLCEASKAILQQNGDQKDLQVKAEQDKEMAVRADYSALLDYSVKLEGHYVDLYNLFAAKKRSGRCLWLWHCKAQTISAPKPEELALPAGLAAQH